MTIVSEQRCWGCCEVLPAEAFGKNASRPSGLSDLCRPCKRSAGAEYYRANKDRILAQQKTRRDLNPEVREANAAHGRAWRSSQENRDRIAGQVAAWKLAHPERWAEIQKQAYARRRARKRTTAVQPITATQIADRMAYFGNACWMCGGAFEHIDHVKPLSKGGPHMLANLRPACRDCNQWKYNKWDGPTALAGYISGRRVSTRV